MNGRIWSGIDEALTPDSSRLVKVTKVGKNPHRSTSIRPRLAGDHRLDKKHRRRPELPDDVVMKTREKYIEAFAR